MGKYVNFASAEGIGGTLETLPKSLEYANFRSALLFKGDVAAVTDAADGGKWEGREKCALRELDLHSSSLLTGKLLVGGKKAGDKIGLFERCKKLRYVDLGFSYKTDGVDKGTFTYPAFGDHSNRCVKANGFATRGCQ